MSNTEFKVKAADFMTAIKRVKHCMSGNEGRRNLMGVNLAVSENDLSRLNITAADSFRIARQSIEIATGDSFDIIIDYYTIKAGLIEKHLKQYEKTDKIIKCRIHENAYLYFEDDPDCFNIELKEEEYPTDGVNRLLTNSESSANQIIINDVNSFYRAAEYIYYASESCSRAVIKLSLSKIRKDGYNDNKTVSLAMGLNLNNMYFKEALFNVTAEGSDTKTHIGLNVPFLKEALKVFKTLKAERLILSYKDNESPCFMMADVWNDRLEAGYTFQQLILPVKLKY